MSFPAFVCFVGDVSWNETERLHGGAFPPSTQPTTGRGAAPLHIFSLGERFFFRHSQAMLPSAR